MEFVIETLDNKKGSSDSRAKAFKDLRGLLAERWLGEEEEEFLDYLPNLTDAIRSALKQGKSTEKRAALLALQLVLLAADASVFQKVHGLLEYLVREPCEVSSLACDVLSLGLWLHSTGEIDTTGVDKALALCQKTKDSQRAFALLLTTKSNEDVLDIVFPESSWVVDRFERTEGATQIEVGWTMCSLFCALYEERGEEGYDPYEMDGYVRVDEFSDGLRNVKAFKDLEKMFDTGVIPAETLEFNNQKFVFRGFRKVMQIRFLRAMLGPAFAVQMAENGMLFEMLDYYVDAKVTKTKMSGVEKRLFKSPNSASSRNASKGLKKDRQRKMMTQSFEFGEN